MKEISVTAILKRKRGRIWFHCIGLAQLGIIIIRLTKLSLITYSENPLGITKVSNAMFMRKDMVHEDDYWRLKKRSCCNMACFVVVCFFALLNALFLSIILLFFVCLCDYFH